MRASRRFPSASRASDRPCVIGGRVVAEEREGSRGLMMIIVDKALQARQREGNPIRVADRQVPDETTVKHHAGYHRQLLV